MIWSVQLVLVLCIISLCSGNDGLRTPGKSLVIIFDVTSSMALEIQALSNGVQILMDDFVSRKDNPIENYIFVPFRDDELDPDILPIFISSNYSSVKEKLQTIGINDGINGDCAESSYSAIKRGLEVANEDSICFILTDAGTKNHELLPDIHRLIVQKRAQLNFLISTGGCDEQNFLEDYYNLASVSKGLLFIIMPDDINVILPIYGRLIKTDGLVQYFMAGTEGNSTSNLIIEKSIKEFTIVVSADDPNIKLYYPNLTLVTETQMLLETLDFKIITIKNPTSGVWRLEIETDSPFTAQTSIISDLQFKYGFSANKPNSLSDLNPYPLKGENTFLVIHPKHSYSYDLEYVLFVSQNNTNIRRNLQRKTIADGDIFLTESFPTPTKPFKIVLHGKDPANQIFEKLLLPSIQVDSVVRDFVST